jgi:hypothetical protein
MKPEMESRGGLPPITPPDGFQPGRSWIEFTDSSEFEAAQGQRLKHLNGTLLHNAAGTIWLVVNGEARGFTSAALLERLHDWYWVGPIYLDNGGIAGTGRWPHALKWTEIADIRFIKEGSPWTESLRYVHNSAGTEAIYDNGILYGVPSVRVRQRYQLRETKAIMITDEEWNSYPMPVILKMPDGSV